MTERVVQRRVSREDWLDAAQKILISQGEKQVKVLSLSQRLGVSRSSFYWYFENRAALLDELLARWQDVNTAALVGQASAPAAGINAAVCNVFRCVVDERLFDTRLDFAIRDWARRSAAVRTLLAWSDAVRIDALAGMFARFGYPENEAVTRARVLYYMQIGYEEADLRETLETRLANVPGYLLVFTGVHPETEDMRGLLDWARSTAPG